MECIARETKVQVTNDTSVSFGLHDVSSITNDQGTEESKVKEKKMPGIAKLQVKGNNSPTLS